MFRASIEDDGLGPTVRVNGRSTHLGGIGRGCHRRESPSLLGADVGALCLLWPQTFFQVGSPPDIDALIDQYATLLHAQPDALLSTVITLAPSAQWVEAHPEQMTGYDLPMDSHLPENQSRSPEPSWASQAWRDEVSQFLHQTVSALHKAFDGRIVLYHFGAGKCGENFPVSDPIRYGQWYCGDFSAPMRSWFRDWLRQHYADVQSLRDAWGESAELIESADSTLDFENAQVPSRDERLRSDWFSFRSPRRAQVADYYRAWSDAIQTSLIQWADAIKEATNGQALTSTAIGGVLDCGINADTLQHLKRHKFDQCLASSSLDMLESPASYVLRDLGHGDTTAMIPVGSLGLHGKLWFRDFDSRTSLSKSQTSQDPSSVLWNAPRDVWQDEQLLKRDAGYSIVKGGAWWWHEIVPEMYAHPEHRRVAERIDQVAVEALRYNRKAAPGMAVLVDPASDYALANANRLIYPMNYESRRRHWTRTGMAAETYLIDDVSHPDMPDHSVLMVTNAFAITDEQVTAVKRQAERTGATLIWMVAPGVVGTSGFSTDRVSDIVGMPIRALDVETQPTIRMLPGQHPWSTIALPDGGTLDTFGAGPRRKDDSAMYTFGPQFYVDDTQCDDDVCVLGLNETIARPGLVVKNNGAYRTVFCTAPYLHHALLHAIGKDSGAHLYVPCGHVLHASQGLLLVNATQSEQLPIAFPTTCETILDMYDGQVLDRGVSHIDLPMQAMETRLIAYGRAEAL